MSHAGQYIKTATKFFNALEEGKPHSSITDWIEVLSSDRYDELSLDGIPELVESVNIQGHVGTTEASRAIRKKLKYGNVHRQLRALVILRALTENASKGFQINWANQELLTRLKDMASDTLLDPKVKKRLVLVFHAWSIQYKDEPRMQAVAKLYSQHMGGPGARKPTTVAPSSQSRTTTPRASLDTSRPGGPQGGFSDYNDLFSHDWQPSAGQRGPDTYSDLAAAKADAEERKRQREARIATEQREAEIERREREIRRKQDMTALEARRQKDAAEEAERRRIAKEELKRGKNQPKRPKFDFEKEKPQIMVSVATALQAANNLVNSCRHLNREIENVRESPKVQENLDKAKAARRSVIRYIQVVQDEEYVGTLLDANEKVVEAIQLYDKLSKPAVLDSDSEDESSGPASNPREMEALSKRLEAQKLEADRTGELQQLQERQKRESARRAQRRAPPQPSRSAHPDLQDLDFGSIGQDSKQRLPTPLRPDSEAGSTGGGSSDYSDFEYDSSDDEWRQRHQSRSRRQSRAGPSGSGSGRHDRGYAALDEEKQSRGGLLDPNDPFGDPFADEADTPMQEKPRMQWAEI